MLDRVVMNIIDVPGIIVIITDPMLGKAPLPQGDLSPLMSRCGLARPKEMADRLGDVAFEQAPTY